MVFGLPKLTLLIIITSDLMESRGKSWKREREERGRKQLVQQDSNGKKDSREMDPRNGSMLNPHTDHRVIKSETEDPCQELENKIQEQESEDKSAVNVSSEEEKQELMQYIKELSEKLRLKAELRSININAESMRPEESFFSRLDSSLKKNTAFIKRLRNMTEMQRDSLIKDMDGLNLTKYISEAASAIVDAKLKMSDVSTAVQICSLLHRRYSDFSSQLLEHWQKVLPMKKDEKISNPSKIRVDLRFYAELVSSGIFILKEGLPLLGNLLTVLTVSDREEHSNVGIVLSFCRHCGEDYTGMMPRRYRLLNDKYHMDMPKSDFLPPDRQKGLRNLLKEYYRSLCRHLIKDFKALENMEKQNHRILQTKGELSSERKEKFESAQNAFQKLYSNTEQFSDIVDEDFPNLPKDESFPQDSETTTLDVHNRFKDREILDGSLLIWEDEDTRSFYENLPDLKAFIPGILFKDSSQAVSQNQTETVEKLEEDLGQLEVEEAELMEVETKEEMKEAIKGDDKDLTETLMQEMDETDEEAAATNTANKVLLDGFLNSLLNCVNREIIDKAAVDFCMNLNTRPNRKKLVRALFLVPRTRLDLLPFYARFVATLNPCMPDVASDLVSMLKQDFKFHIKKKDQINIESKVKTVRFIGELVKFKVFPKSEALYCLKLLLSDFIHHHVEMACNLLETCGRFLFQAPDSHQRIKVLLEQMMRKKAVMSIDSRYTTMIENAFYYCNPPEVAPIIKVERPPMHEYIRKLLYQDLTKTNNDKSSEKQSPSARVLRQMRKLNWEDDETAAYITKCLIAVWNVKYYNIRCLANLLAGLVSYQENVGPQVVDGVLEDIRFGLEVNHPKFNQRRVSMVRYLGELYNYRMVESTVIFRVLYMLILFGVNYDGTYSELDPPENLFRIRLVCILLDTCGQYFNSGSSKRKLDYFLIFFQRYYWHKRSADIYTDNFPFPVYVNFMMTDTISCLRPKLKLYQNLEEAEKAVMNAVEELKPKYMEIYPGLVGEEQDKPKPQPQTNDEDSLCPIEEEDEEMEDDAQSETSFQDGETENDTDGFSGSQSQPFEDETEGLGRHGTSLSDADNDPVYDANGEAVVVKSSSQPAQSAEDDDFMAAFDKMLSDSMLHRNLESVKPQVDIVIPMNIKGGSTIKKTPKFISPTISAVLEEKEQEKPTVNFVLMTRKGNKQQFKNLAVPVSSELAQNLKDREEAERMEKQHVKLLTLNINERQEEEDYQEMLASQQRPSVMNLNRDRRQKYHHPKGAPDKLTSNLCVASEWVHLSSPSRPHIGGREPHAQITLG
ncbi:regulator of nonsense transcripts 2 [Nephila pilipes]|uniref:Regulator of nonsense transcripts 2 n=1 Tax=Nephila pilipes TaxID=299642 RepID=A0A8X6N5J8_NEPPI|nr:regulator of nonsense transcripts 2 [Nephila pilipes]